ncbi:hypothetical protein ULMS_16690 [Patiriisocius marinistellae]|uniref:SMI1/KNR4 family protein n=1 Tax=Patiriisocius marinistellae TaxID=2494560 RepID=A0A5J4G232_9FLAO|nr:hypothetical protein [Patiriisocius marinistellae]GEQ86161.1 hypothetical protein ULMS_16690 [Patiriisocius marinistellae]
MISNKIKTFCQSKGWWYEDYTEEYTNALKELKINLESDFAKFYLHVEDAPTFYSRQKKIYQICWFILNSDYQLDLNRTHDALKLPKSLIPLDSFEGGAGYFYDRENGSVIELELGEKLTNYQNGIIEVKWETFNSFLEWYFEL